MGDPVGVIIVKTVVEAWRIGCGHTRLEELIQFRIAERMIQEAFQWTENGLLGVWRQLLEQVLLDVRIKWHDMCAGGVRHLDGEIASRVQRVETQAHRFQQDELLAGSLGTTTTIISGWKARPRRS